MSSENHIIINLDIVGFSIKNENKQIELFSLLQKEVYYQLYSYFHSEKPTASIIPIGDGMIISIKDDINGSNSYNLIFNILKLIIILNKWKEISNTLFRFALHSGIATGLLDINRTPNIIGHAINSSARLITGALDGELIISKEFLDRYFNINQNETIKVNNIYGEYFLLKLEEEGAIIDKHGKEHQAYTVSILNKDNVALINSTKIKSKYETLMYHKDYPKIDKLKTDISTILKNCKKAIFWGTYFPNGKYILDSLKENELFEEVCFYIASDNLKNQLEDKYGNDFSITSKHNFIRAVDDFISESKLANKIKLFEYCELPVFGFSMFDYETSGKGLIHISHFIPGVLPKDSPYMDLKWNTNEPNSIYKLYKDKILELLSKTQFKKIEMNGSDNHGQ